MIKREKRLRLPGFDVSVRMRPETVSRIAANPAYRYFVAPALRALGGGSNGRNGHSAHRQPFNFKPGGTAPTAAPPLSPEGQDILRRVQEIDWYHTIELPHGVTTPGFVDHRDQIRYYGLPDDMHGMRALDIATFDGFWAMEMERRGAEVLAIDIGRWSDADIPARWKERMPEELDVKTGAGFNLARELFNSRVDRREINVYDVSPEEIGKFDLIVISDLLQHLRDPQKALEKVYSVTSDTGALIVAEVYNEQLEQFEMPLAEHTAFVGFAWSLANTAALKLMLNVAGFHPVEEVSRFYLEHREGTPTQKVVLRAYPWQRKHVISGKR